MQLVKIIATRRALICASNTILHYTDNPGQSDLPLENARGGSVGGGSVA